MYIARGREVGAYADVYVERERVSEREREREREREMSMYTARNVEVGEYVDNAFAERGRERRGTRERKGEKEREREREREREKCVCIQQEVWK